MKKWEKYFSFEKNTDFYVDGPFGYDGKGKVLERTDNTLSLRLDIPKWSFVPELRAVVTVIYKQEEGGNTVILAIDGEEEKVDNNAFIVSDDTRMKRRISANDITCSIRSYPNNLEKIKFDVNHNGKQFSFDFENVSITKGNKTVRRINPDKPAVGNLPKPPERALSSINLPFSIDIGTITSFINNTLSRGEIASDSGRDGNTKRWSYHVFRNRSATFSSHGDELIVTVPLDIKANGSYTACVGYWHDGRCCSAPNPFGRCISGVTSTEHGNVSTSANIEIRVRLDMNEDYSVSANTYLRGYITGDTHLHIDLIGNLIRINIDIRDKLERPLRQFVTKYSRQINEKVSSLVASYNIKESVNEYWGESFSPVNINDDFWLNLVPKKIVFKNLTTEHNKLSMALGIVAQLSIDDTQDNIHQSPLPNLTLDDKLDQKFYIYLPVSAGIDTLERIVSEKVIGKTYTKNDISVTIKDIDIYGSRLNEAAVLIIGINVDGNVQGYEFSGNIFFSAVPMIDDHNKIIGIDQFMLTPSTTSELINQNLPHLFDDFYYNELSQSISYSYRDDYDKFLAMVNANLNNIQIGSLVVKGKMDEILAPGLYIDNKSVQLLLIARGIFNSTIN